MIRKLLAVSLSLVCPLASLPGLAAQATRAESAILLDNLRNH